MRLGSNIFAQRRRQIPQFRNAAAFRIGSQPARGQVLHDGYPAWKTCGLNPVIVGAELLGALQVLRFFRRADNGDRQVLELFLLANPTHDIEAVPPGQLRPAVRKARESKKTSSGSSSATRITCAIELFLAGHNSDCSQLIATARWKVKPTS